MINVLYHQMGKDWNETWDMCDGFLKAAKKTGVLDEYFVASDNQPETDIQAIIKSGCPTIVPVNHREPIFHVPEALKKTKMIRVEMESTRRPGQPNPHQEQMKRAAQDYHEIYTNDWYDKDDFFGRKCKFYIGIIDTDVFRDIGEPSNPKILTFGNIGARATLYDQCADIIQHKQSTIKDNALGNANSLNRMINEFRFLLVPTSTYVTHVSGKAFYGMACKRMIFIEENAHVQYLKQFIIPGIHAVYFKNSNDLKEKYYHYLENPSEVKNIVNAAYQFVIDNCQTKNLILRINKDQS